MATLRTLIVDDEEVARRGLRALLENETGVEVVAECAGGKEAITAIRTYQPDLVFLDVEMPKVSGFDVLRALDPEELPLVIFVTAYDLYALKAFDVHAVDYLLKPFSDRRFRESLALARAQIQQQKDLAKLSYRLFELIDRLDPEKVPAPEAPSYLQRIPVKERGATTLLDVEQIDWIEAANNYVSLHVGSRTYLVRATISGMEEKLDPQHFLRIHRSRIVNIGRIRALQPLQSGDCLVMLKDGTELVSSRSYSEQRRRVLNPLV